VTWPILDLSTAYTEDTGVTGRLKRNWARRHMMMMMMMMT